MCERAQHTSTAPLADQLVDLYLKSDENSDNPNKLNSDPRLLVR